jgi:hypothetical protein
MTHRRPLSLCALVVCALIPACRTAPATPTPAERRQRGDALITRMSDRLAAAQRLSFTTTEELARTRDDARRAQKLSRQIVVRRPDRLYFKVSGDRDMEAFYDGRRFTLVSHRDKVFGDFLAPPALDATVDMLGARYDIPLPVGDLLAANPRQALMSTQTTGGWVADESIDGVVTARLEWRHPNVDWSVWIPTTGAPLPKKMFVRYKTRRGLPEATMTFANWNLDVQVPEGIFTARVPPDYEGIAIIQRADSVLPSYSDPTPTATSGRTARR